MICLRGGPSYLRVSVFQSKWNVRKVLTIISRSEGDAVRTVLDHRNSKTVRRQSSRKNNKHWAPRREGRNARGRFYSKNSTAD